MIRSIDYRYLLRKPDWDNGGAGGLMIRSIDYRYLLRKQDWDKGGGSHETIY